MHSRKKIRSVRFSTIDIREYDTAISTNPSCSRGPGLELGWGFSSLNSIPVEEFEEKFPSGLRRKARDMLIPLERRELILKEAGYSRREIEECRREMYTMQLKQRSMKKTISKSFSKVIQISLHSSRRSLLNCAA